jgi:RNA polymerase sigma factor (sigma-70 family)
MHGKQAGSVGIAPPCTDVATPPAPCVYGELTERELCEQALRGDHAAWCALVARHDHRILLSLLARGIPLADARELTQQTWTRLLAQQRAGRLARLELPGLAIRQAGFLALDAARRVHSAMEHCAAERVGDSASDPSASVEERLIRREELERVRNELALCAPQARRLFALLYNQPGMPHAEAARQLGLSVQRVRQILCEVRSRLRGALETEPT